MSNIYIKVNLFECNWHTLLIESDLSTSCCDNRLYKPLTAPSQVDFLWPTQLLSYQWWEEQESITLIKLNVLMLISCYNKLISLLLPDDRCGGLLTESYLTFEWHFLLENALSKKYSAHLDCQIFRMPWRIDVDTTALWRGSLGPWNTASQVFGSKCYWIMLHFGVLVNQMF